LAGNEDKAMNCAVHPEAPAAAYCRACGKALCEECRRVAGGTVYCADHAGEARTSEQSYTAPAPRAMEAAPTHPGLAFLLGFIPGVGAIYNAQYAKGLVHALIFGLIISILNSDAADSMQPLLALLLAVFVFSRRRSLGLPVDEFSSIVPPSQRQSTAGAVTLIVVGAVFLLSTLDIIEMHQILRFWPALLILLGVGMLRSRVGGGNG
jgi:hypothetical protein